MKFILILEIIYMAIGAMAVIYVIFNIGDFLQTWWRWTKLLGSGLWKGIRYLWRMMTGWIGKR